MGSRHRDRSRSPRDRSRSRHRDRDRDKDRDRGERDRGRDRDRERDRDRHRTKRDRSKGRSRERSRSRDRRSKDDRKVRRSRSRGRKSKDRDGTIALLDQMVGTTTTTSARHLNGNGPASNPAAQAAILAAAAVAQQRRIAAPVQPAAAAAAALSAAAAIPPPTAVQQRLEQLQARKDGRHGGSDYGGGHGDHVSSRYEPDDDDVDDGQGPPGETSAERRARRKRSRWAGSEHDKTFIPGLPTVLPSTLTKEQEEQYLLQLQIEEVSRKLRSGDLGIPANIEERSPSPEPIYSSDGKRLNTREYRTRRKLEEQRHKLVQRMQLINPDFKPPADYKPPIIRVHDKVMIPQEEHPDINFVGLLIGPRGNTLKSMEKETGAKIIIRGKGSVKEGKVGRKDGQPLPGEDEPLHAYITATNAECVKKAVEKIKEVIRQGVEVPEGQNDLRRMQLRELAQLNGTLRENDAQRCANCGATDHKSWLCPDKPNVTNNIVCSSCGGAGHIARDCRAKRPGAGGPPGGLHAPSRAKIDEEYLSLMAELGEAPPPASAGGMPGGQRKPFYGGPFGGDGPRGQPRAIMGAPAGGGGGGMNHPPPPHLVPPSLPPPPVAAPPFAPPPPPPAMPRMPWMNNNGQPPPPGSSSGPPGSGGHGGSNSSGMPSLVASFPPPPMSGPHMGGPQNDKLCPPGVGGGSGPPNMGPPHMGGPGPMGPPGMMGGMGMPPPWRFPGGPPPPPPQWGAAPPPPPPGVAAFLAPPPPPPPS